MIGIVLVSHGKMAEGICDSASMLFGDLEQVKTVSLVPGEGPEDFDKELLAAIDSVDTGDGVVVLADLMGGTPCNRCIFNFQYKKYQVIAGMSLPMFIELLGMRMAGTVDFDSLIESAQNSVINVNKKFGI